MKFLKYILSVVLILLPTAVYSDSNLANFIIRNHDTHQLPMVGNIDGEYTIVEFFDYRCGYCSKQANDFANIIKTRNDTKIIYLEFPIFGGISETAANVALKIWNENPDLYFDIHNGLMKLGSSMNKQNIINLLNQLDLEGGKIFNFSETQPYDKTIQLNKKLAKDLGLRGTPASIINNTLIPGYIKEQKIIELLDDAKTAS